MTEVVFVYGVKEIAAAVFLLLFFGPLVVFMVTAKVAVYLKLRERFAWPVIGFALLSYFALLSWLYQVS